MKIKCLAVDDEPLAIEKIKGYIERVDTLELTGSFNNAIDALTYINNHKVDVVFLDVQMEELTGIQMLEALDEKPVIILTTAYDKYSLKGYDLNVTDYLLKPFSFQRFMQAVGKAYDALSVRSRQKSKLISSEDNLPGSGYLFVRTDGKMIKINYKDIIYIEGMRDYVRIQTTDQRIMSLQRMSKLIEILPERCFVRIYRSYIVAIDKIEAIQRKSVVVNGKTLPIGLSFRKHFMYVIEKGRLIL
ncbi:MAG: LytTR family DNA-binding domain-containing protein [Bacteroidales bacterium]|nr:LytTR family DNA-binding domain-containing protein [Bacteroidales bacterium]